MRPYRVIVKVSAILLITLSLSCSGRETAFHFPGLQEDGRYLLPEGLLVSTPANTINVSGNPVDLTVSDEEDLVFLLSRKSEVSYVCAVSLSDGSVIDSLALEQLSIGMKHAGDGHLYISGGNADNVVHIRYYNGEFHNIGEISIKTDNTNQMVFPAGIATSADNKFIVSTLMTSRSAAFISAGEDRINLITEVGSFPFDVVIDHENCAWISCSGENKIIHIDPENRVDKTPVSLNFSPGSMALSNDGKTLFAAGFTADSIALIDVASASVSQVISAGPFTGAPDGSQISSLAVSDDGELLAAAHSGTNEISIFSLSGNIPEKTARIPAGLRPVSLQFIPGTKRLLCANFTGAGNSAAGRGSISVIDLTKTEDFEELTKISEENNRYRQAEEALSFGEAYMALKAVPEKTGETSLIRNVILIVKGNLSFDLVLGDSDSPFADSARVIFDSGMTPDHHGISDEYCLFDNYYSPDSVLASGMIRSFTGTPPVFSDVFLAGLSEDETRQFDSLRYVPGKFIWEGAADSGIRFKTFGVPEKFIRISPSLRGNSSEDPVWSRFSDATDIERASQFISEFKADIESGAAPELSIVVLPGGRTDFPAMSYENVREQAMNSDIAAGMIVESISTSEVWNETAVFIMKNDSRKGMDHFHPRRSILLAASPYTERGKINHTHYSPASVIRTISLILGIRPLNLHAAAAEALHDAFVNRADITPYSSRH